MVMSLQIFLDGRNILAVLFDDDDIGNLEILASVIKEACEYYCVYCMCLCHDIMLDLITFHHND